MNTLAAIIPSQVEGHRDNIYHGDTTNHSPGDTKEGHTKGDTKGARKWWRVELHLCVQITSCRLVTLGNTKQLHTSKVLPEHMTQVQGALFAPKTHHQNNLCISQLSWLTHHYLNRFGLCVCGFLCVCVWGGGGGGGGGGGACSASNIYNLCPCDS